MPFDSFTWKGKPVLFDKARAVFLKDLQDHIEKFGLQSPIYAQMNRGDIRVRRGNNRIVALRNLGHTTVPTFLVDYDMHRKRSAPAGWERRGYDRDALQERFFSVGNCILQIQRRTASVVITHVPTRGPGNRSAEYKLEIAQHEYQ